MSDTQPLSTLSDLDLAEFSAGNQYEASDYNTMVQALETTINAAIDALQDIENHRAGSSAPTDNTTRGQIWADTTNAGRVILKVDPDGSGADDIIATAAEAYLIDFKTAGAATFRVGGVINVDTTQVALSTTGVLESYTLPAGTLARDGQAVRITMWGTKTNANADASIQIRFNSGVQHTFTLDDNADEWLIEWWIVRTGAATQKFAAMMKMDRDDTGKTDLVGIGTDAETLANALAIDANLSSVNASDTVTKEGMIVEFLNY